MSTIESLLYRRLDLSTFLVHFTREGNNRTAYENLSSILSDGRLNAGSRLGKAKDTSVANQEVVCFTETPLEHAWTLTGEIKGRQVTLQPYGVVFTKIWARRKGVNPVWYIDASPAPGHYWLTNHVDKMINKAIETGEHDDEIFQLTPFFEVMGTWTNSRNEFWWEREWRKVGSLDFFWSDLVAVFAPAADHISLQKALEDEFLKGNVPKLNFLDSEWGLERMIGRLAGINSDNLGPLPRYP